MSRRRMCRTRGCLRTLPEYNRTGLCRRHTDRLVLWATAALGLSVLAGALLLFAATAAR